jgi:hypothetical protein
MKSGAAVEKYILLYLPWGLSLLLQSNPLVSYFTAWLGSFFIFYVTLTGKIRPLPADRPVAEQLMRPIFIVQIIFAGYMACTSIFYFLSILGYQNFHKLGTYVLIDQEAIELTARCQRYYCLGHAAFVSGILFFMKYPVKTKYYVEQGKLAKLVLQLALISFPLSLILVRIPGLEQFNVQLSSLSFISGTLALAFAIQQKNQATIWICIVLYIFNFYEAFISGYKEPIIISVMVLGIFLYPLYKKLVIIIFVPALLLLFSFLPAYVSAFRGSAWSGGETAENASQEALDAALNQEQAGDTNWEFLVFRLSEIDMFDRYIKSTPEYVDYYRFTLLEQSAFAIVPRVLWPSKPNTEALIMERVYNAGVINRGSDVSAKPAFIVDAYLSYGPFGIVLFLFAYGALAQAISIKAEKLFGGYVLGTALIFSGLFQTFWRGLSLEFLVNIIFWSYVSMMIVFWILRSKNFIKVA